MFSYVHAFEYKAEKEAEPIEDRWTIDVLAIDPSKRMMGLARVDRFWHVCSAMYVCTYNTDNLTLIQWQARNTLFDACTLVFF
jgi:hypothetical protein